MGAPRSRSMLVLFWWMTHSAYALHNDSLAWNLTSSSIFSTSTVDRTSDPVLLSTKIISTTDQQSEVPIALARIASVENTSSASDGNNHSHFSDETISTSNTPSSNPTYNASLAAVVSSQTSPVLWTRPLDDTGSRIRNSTLDYILRATKPSPKPTAEINFLKSSPSDLLNSTANITSSQTWPTANSTLTVSATVTPLFLNSTANNTTCPMTSYAPDFPAKVLHLSGCESQTRYIKDMYYYNYEDRCLASYCKTSWFSAIDAYTGPIPTITTKIPYMSIDFDDKGSAISFGPLTTLTFSYNGTGMDVVRIDPPCCRECLMRVKNLNVYYWPDQAMTGLASENALGASESDSIVDEDGFTFISPSVYIAITSLRAWNACGQVGPTILTTTMAFDATDISTISPVYDITTCDTNLGAEGWAFSETVTRQMTWADLQRNCSTYPGYIYNPDFPYMYWMSADPCHPYIQIPSKVRQIHPEWQECIPHYFGGFHDPPRTLRPAQVLVPTATASVLTTTRAATMAATPGSGLMKIPVSTANAAPPQEPPPDAIRNPFILPPKPTEIAPIAPKLPPIQVTIRPNVESVGEPKVVTMVPTWIEESRNHVNDQSNAQPDSPSDRTPTPGFAPGTLGVVVGSQTVLPGHEITLDDTTLTLANSQISTIPGVRISLDPDATQIIVQDRSTVQTIPVPQPVAPLQVPPFVLTLGHSTFTADPAGRFIVGQQTLLPGGIIMIEQTTTTLSNQQASVFGGTLVYLDPQGTAVIIDGRTSSTLARARATFEAVRTTVVEGRTYTIPRTGDATIVVGGVTRTLLDGRLEVVGGRTSVLRESVREQGFEVTDVATQNRNNGQTTLDRGLSTSVGEQTGADAKPPGWNNAQTPSPTAILNAASRRNSDAKKSLLAALSVLFLGILAWH